MPDSRDDVTDRVASRFDSDDNREENEKTEQSEKNEEKAKKEKKVKNVKKEWNAKSIYIPDDLDSKLSKTFKRLDLELDDAVENLKKTRHFYPIVLSEGLERIEEMDREELMERIERIE